MNKSYPTCNACGAINLTSDSTWIRSFGVYQGAPNPVAFAQPQQRTPTGSNTRPPVPIDLCPKCQKTATVESLMELTTAMQPKPALAPAGPTVPAAAK